jgi:predicted ArsR family transcriptional regulator
MSRKEDVLGMVKDGPVSTRDVAGKLGITPTNAAVLLGRLHRERVLDRTGEPKGYRYLEPVAQSATTEHVSTQSA